MAAASASGAQAAGQEREPVSVHVASGCALRPVLPVSRAMSGREVSGRMLSASLSDAKQGRYGGIGTAQVISAEGLARMAAVAVMAESSRVPAQGADEVAQLPLGHGGAEDAGELAQGEQHLGLGWLLRHAFMVPPRAMRREHPASPRTVPPRQLQPRASSSADRLSRLASSRTASRLPWHGPPAARPGIHC